MNTSEIRVEVCKRIGETIRTLHEDGEMTPHRGPIAENSALLHVYEEIMEEEIEKLERRGGQI